jgi:hypothetical protein
LAAVAAGLGLAGDAFLAGVEFLAFFGVTLFETLVLLPFAAAPLPLSDDPAFDDWLDAGAEAGGVGAGGTATVAGASSTGGLFGAPSEGCFAVGCGDAGDGAAVCLDPERFGPADFPLPPPAGIEAVVPPGSEAPVVRSLTGKDGARVPPLPEDSLWRTGIGPPKTLGQP